MLHENIKHLRKAKGLSQEELAQQLHVVRQTVSKWEQGLSVPDAELLIRLSEALDTTVSALLGETVIPQPQTELQELAAKLEQLNDRFARQQERRRKAWHCIFACLGLLTLAILAQALVHGFRYSAAIPSLYQDVGIIGGADGPTSIIVSSVRIRPGRLLALLAVLVLSVIGLFRTRRQ